jgi:hypothetical protein
VGVVTYLLQRLIVPEFASLIYRDGEQSVVLFAQYLQQE